jgi:hypothetical protein
MFWATVAMAPGSCSDVVSALPRLVYVWPPSVETWTKPKSQPSSVSNLVSNVSVGLSAGTVSSRTIARSRFGPGPE